MHNVLHLRSVYLDNSNTRVCVLQPCDLLNGAIPAQVAAAYAASSPTAMGVKLERCVCVQTFSNKTGLKLFFLQ